MVVAWLRYAAGGRPSQVVEDVLDSANPSFDANALRNIP
jgi:hypothetical protein